MRELLGLSRQSIDRLEKADATFPRRIRLGGVVAWPSDALREWMLGRAGRVETR
jgi:predicted DNA-binding transcriptional regulator AlpA